MPLEAASRQRHAFLARGSALEGSRLACSAQGRAANKPAPGTSSSFGNSPPTTTTTANQPTFSQPTRSHQQQAMSTSMFCTIENLVFNGLVVAVAHLEHVEKTLECHCRCHRHYDSSFIVTIAASAAIDAASVTSSAFVQCFDCIRRLLCSLFVVKVADSGTDGSIDDTRMKNNTDTDTDTDADTDADDGHCGTSSNSSASDATVNATDVYTTATTTATKATTTTAAPSPRWQDFAIQSCNFAFTCKIETGFHFRFSHLFATWEERTATRMVLSALHGYWKIISWEHALIPMAYDALRCCDMDEQAAFEYLLANKQLYEHLFTEEWCWKPGCVGCSLPRNKFEYYGDELKAQGLVLYSF